MTHLDDAALIDLALGTGMHPHLAACPGCRVALAQTREALHLIAFGQEPIAPPAPLCVRLMAAVAGPLTRYGPRVAELLGLPTVVVADALARVHADVAPWSEVLPGIDNYALRRDGQREWGLIRAAPGLTFPYHRHVGEERVVVLQGSCADSSGRQLGPGDEIVHTVGTSHHLEIHEGPPLVFAYVTDGTAFAAWPKTLCNTHPRPRLVTNPG